MYYYYVYERIYIGLISMCILLHTFCFQNKYYLPNPFALQFWTKLNQYMIFFIKVSHVQ